MRRKPVRTLVLAAVTVFVGTTAGDYFIADRNSPSIAFVIGAGSAALCTLLIAGKLWPGIFDRPLERRAKGGRPGL